MKRVPLIALMAALSACTFRPDYSGYERCDDAFQCADPQKVCLREERICLPRCGETRPCAPMVDAGGNPDAGPSDAGFDDAGADAGEDAGTSDGGMDAGTPDGGDEDGGVMLEPVLPDAVEQLPYQHTLQVEGGVPPYTFTFVDGMLPKGISFTLGTLSGTPDEAGTATFTIDVRDSAEVPSTDRRAYTLTIEPRLRVASPEKLTNSDGRKYSEPLLAIGGSGAPLLWSVDGGTLPAGLFIDGGVLMSSGNFSGSGTFTLQVDDTGPARQSASRTVTISKGGNITFYLLTAGLPDGRVGTPYSYELRAGSGTPPYGWSVPQGSVLPPGLSVAGNTISGIPTQRGTWTFTIKVDDSNPLLHGSATLNATVTIY
ncbi:MAG: putative Ig domain-containing protein [Myxococcaceae bacterium]|nr:putative Ig domain-containing protein [Myxococcaceae bacterium]